jgi:hypothetical protein
MSQGGPGRFRGVCTYIYIQLCPGESVQYSVNTVPGKTCRLLHIASYEIFHAQRDIHINVVPGEESARSCVNHFAGRRALCLPMIVLRFHSDSSIGMKSEEDRGIAMN